MKERLDRLYIMDILSCIGKISEYIKNDNFEIIISIILN